MRKTLAKPLDLAWLEESGSSTDPDFRDRMCRRTIKHLPLSKSANDWRELFESKNPYNTKKGKGLDYLVRKKA
jgi:hypothetical protein